MSAIIRCDRHRWQGWFYGISKDIQHNIVNDIPMKKEEIIHISVINTIGLIIQDKYFLSESLLRELSVTKHFLDGNKESDDFFEFIEPYLTGICIMCFEDYNEKYDLGLNLNFKRK